MDEYPDLSQASLESKSEYPDLSQSNLSHEHPAASMAYAVPRVAEDVFHGLYNFAREIPNYYEKSKTAIPALYETAKKDPGSLAMQGLAGSQEMINSFAQLPHGIASYGANRLNLLPQGIPAAIKKFGPEDTTQAIKQLFDKPKNEGEELLRGITKHLPEVFGIGRVASKLNPAKLTNKNIAKNIVNTETDVKNAHSERYENLFNQAENRGYHVNADPYRLFNDYQTISANTPDKYFSSLGDFLRTGSHREAQRSVSDLGQLIRKLEKQTTLLTPERETLTSARNARNHIQENMFTNRHGEVDPRLLQQYERLQDSYRRNVIPYTTNDAIQAFKRQDITAKQLVSALKEGKFGAKKGAAHPELYRGENLRNLAIALGVGTGIWKGSSAGYHYLKGDKH